MGSGKSTLLSKFDHNSIGFECHDLDVVLANKLEIDHNRLGVWIEQNGWDQFRGFESKSIRELLESDKDLVIALGGGTLNQELLDDIKKRPEVFIVHLNVPFEICLERVKGDQNRPLLKMNQIQLAATYKTRHEIFSQAHISLEPEEIKSIDGLETLVHNLSSR